MCILSLWFRRNETSFWIYNARLPPPLPIYYGISPPSNSSVNLHWDLMPSCARVNSLRDFANSKEPNVNRHLAGFEYCCGFAVRFGRTQDLTASKSHREFTLEFRPQQGLTRLCNVILPLSNRDKNSQQEFAASKTQREFALTLVCP